MFKSFQELKQIVIFLTYLLQIMNRFRQNNSRAFNTVDEHQPSVMLRRKFENNYFNNQLYNEQSKNQQLQRIIDSLHQNNQYLQNKLAYLDRQCTENQQLISNLEHENYGLKDCVYYYQHYFYNQDRTDATQSYKTNNTDTGYHTDQHHEYNNHHNYFQQCDNQYASKTEIRTEPKHQPTTTPTESTVDDEPDDREMNCDLILCQSENDLMSSEGKQSVVFKDTSEVFWIENEQVAKRSKRKIEYKVVYEGVEFDLIGFNLIKMKQVMVDCGAAFTTDRRNEFFNFMAGMATKLNKNKYWKYKHTLGTSDDWLALLE